jgi:hypothetical protein
MPKKKMRFPEVPGDTPREQFTNLVRHVISLPKSTVETRQNRKRRKNAKGALVLVVLLILGIGALVSMLFIAIQTFAQDAPRKTWYDGGYEFGGSFVVPGCFKVDESESPAEKYKAMQESAGGAELTDEGGDVVSVKGANGETYYYFKTKAACKARAAELKKQKKEQENTLDQYR